MTGLRFSMIGKGFLSAFAFLLSLAMVLWAAPANAADPAVYGALPDAAEVEISPDGKTIAVLHNIQGAAAVFFYDLGNPQSQPTGINVGSANARNIQWADNDQLLLQISVSERTETATGMEVIEFFRWVSVSKSTQKATLLLGNEPGFFVADSGELLAALPEDPKRAVFSRFTVKGRTRGAIRTISRLENITPEAAYGLLSVNLKNGQRDIMETGNPNTVRWIVDAAGKPVARIDANASGGGRNLYVANEKGRFTKLESAAGLSFVGSGPTPGTLIATSFKGGDKGAAVEFDLATGEIGEPLFSHPEYEIGGYVYESMNAQITGVVYTDDLPRTYYFSEADRKTQKMLSDALPGASPSIVSRADDGMRMIVRVEYTDHPAQFFFYDKGAQRLDVLQTSYRALAGQVVAQNEKFDYAASDGLMIPGYLTVPKGASKQSMPLIVLPHGGPEARDNQAFDWWSFFYASRGYLVYRPNFRGSDGYGSRFSQAGHGEWGRRMQDDITEGVEKLIADGIVDPERVCIVGASYGGYAALAGATLTPELYACAVSVNGVTNLMGMLGDASQSSGLSEDYWRVRIGDRFRNEDEINAVSPINLVRNAKAPIMLIHGKDDTVVPVGHSREMRNRLRDAGKAYEYVELPGEDHWLSTSAMRTEMLRRSIEFIDAHIGE